MADFTTPFGSSSERRLATPDEKTNGFPCGPADQRLFNGLMYQIQAELKSIHDEAGIAGDDSHYHTTLDAILALIAAATGGGGGDTYVLKTQAQARLPIFPEIVTADYKMDITMPVAGTIRVPGAVTFIHRGLFPIETVQTDLVSVASKTYHLRWSLAGGWALKDLADVAYNPSALTDGDTSFDSKFDDMLVARVVTNSSNVATITKLANAVRLNANGGRSVAAEGANANVTVTLDWARTPNYALRSFNIEAIGDKAEVPWQLTTAGLSRYAWTGNLLAYAYPPGSAVGNTTINSAFSMQFWSN